MPLGEFGQAFGLWPLPTYIFKFGMQEAQWSVIVVLSFDYIRSSFLVGYNYRGKMKA